MIKHYKLADGEELITDEIIEDDGSVTWNMPMRMTYVNQGPMSGLAVTPYISGSAKVGMKVINVNKEKIIVGEVIGPDVDKEDIYKSFNEKVRNMGSPLKQSRKGVVTPTLTDITRFSK